MAFLNGPNRHLGTLYGISTVCHDKWCGRSQPHIVEILDEMMMSGLTPISQFDNCASLCIFATTWSLRCTLPAMEPHRNVWASAESDSPKTTPNAPRGETSALVQLPMPRRGFKRRLHGGWVGGTISRTGTFADAAVHVSALGRGLLDPSFWDVQLFCWDVQLLPNST